MRPPNADKHLRAGTAAAVLGVAAASLLSPGLALGGTPSTITTTTSTTASSTTTTDTAPTTTTATSTTTTTTTTTATTTTDTTPTDTTSTPTPTDTTPTTTDTTPATATDTTATDTTPTDTAPTSTSTVTTPTTATDTTPTTTIATTTTSTTTKPTNVATSKPRHRPGCTTGTSAPRGSKRARQAARRDQCKPAAVAKSQKCPSGSTAQGCTTSTPANEPALNATTTTTTTPTTTTPTTTTPTKTTPASTSPALTPESTEGTAIPPAESAFGAIAPLPRLSPELSTLTASALKLLVKTFPVPPFLLPIYQAASIQYGVPWEVLAAINEIETNFGRDVSVSSAGAEGWMQFMPSTWAKFGLDADGRGKANPYDPIDAIFSAARYLRAAGASTGLPNAVFAYNHATWYVNSVELRARLLQALPQNLVDGLIGLMESSYPIAGRLGRDATATPKLVRIAGRPAAVVAAPGNAAVVAGADSRVVSIGDSATLGHYVTLEDSFGDRITYGRLGALASVYPVVTPDVESIRQLTKRLGLRSGKVAKKTTKLPAATRLSAASFAGVPASTANERKAIVSTSSTRSSSTVTATTGTPLVKERLFADPSRPASYAAGGSLQLQSSVRSYLAGASSKIGRASDVLAREVRLKSNAFTLAPLTVGADVVAGTVLGRISGAAGSAQKLVVEVKPAGAGQAIDPRAVIASWRLLGQLTGGAGALGGTAEGTAYDSRNSSLGQLLMSDRAALEEAVLNDPRLTIDACDREAIADGEVDTRILGVLEYLSYSDLAPTVTGLAPNDTGLSCAAPAGSGPRFEITAIDGVSVLGHQRAGSLVDLADRQLLALQGRLAPTRVISLRRYPWQTEALSLPDHAADIEVDFGSAARSSNRGLRAAWARLSKRLNQLSGS